MLFFSSYRGEVSKWAVILCMKPILLIRYAWPSEGAASILLGVWGWSWILRKMAAIPAFGNWGSQLCFGADQLFKCSPVHYVGVAALKYPLNGPGLLSGCVWGWIEFLVPAYSLKYGQIIVHPLLSSLSSTISQHFWKFVRDLNIIQSIAHAFCCGLNVCVLDSYVEL